MADDLTLNLGSGGQVLATDQAAGLEHYQQVKLIDGTADSTTEIQAGAGTASNALRMTIASDSPFALKAGSATIGTVNLGTFTSTAATSPAKLEDQASAGGDMGMFCLARRTASPADQSGADGDYEGIQMDNGRLWTSTAGGVAHDAAYSENPLPIGVIAYATDNTAPGTNVAEADLTRLKASLDGRLFVDTRHPNSWSATSNTSTADTAVLKTAPGAGLSLYVTSITVSSLTAQTTKFTSDSAGTPADEIEIIYTGANGNHTQTFPNAIRLPANVNLARITTAAVATSVTVTGYIAA